MATMATMATRNKTASRTTPQTDKAARDKVLHDKALHDEALHDEALPVIPLKPVDVKIGEGEGNLRAREEAYKRRHKARGD